MEFWKKAALRIRVLERNAEKEVHSLKKVDCKQTDHAQELMNILSKRNQLRKILKEAISAMQETREIIEKGLMIRRMPPGGQEAPESSTEAAYAREVKNLTSSRLSLTAIVSEILESSQQEFTATAEESKVVSFSAVDVNKLSFLIQAVMECCSASTSSVILKVISRLREVERDFDFQSELLKARYIYNFLMLALFNI